MNTSKLAFWCETEDWHTAGEPFRIVHKLPLHCSTNGSTVAERRQNVVFQPGHPLDVLRKSLCHEPRGHADMYGGFITPPNDNSAHFGVLFWHKDGFSTACGHGSIALGCWAIANNIVDKPEDGNGVVDVVIDVPSGRVTAQVHMMKNRIMHVDFINVSSYQLAKDVCVELKHTTVTVDLAFSGAVYAILEASQVGLSVEAAAHDDFVRIGREIKAKLGNRGSYDSYDLYGCIFFDNIEHALGSDHIHQRNVTVFADGQIDRSPCGSGTAGRVAVLLAQGIMTPTSTLIHDSIVGSTFEATVGSIDSASPSQFPSCVPRVRGMAHLTGRQNFYIDSGDPIYPGFLFR